MIIYWLLIPLTFINGMALGYFSMVSSVSKDWTSFIFLVLINVIPLWAFIAKYSKNLIFDELLYNIIVVVSELIAVLALGGGVKFSPLNWLGFLLALIGFVLLKLTLPPKITGD
jgi:hypothetical protein